MNINMYVNIDSVTEERALGIRRQKFILLEGEKQWIGRPERITVAPGDFDLVAEFAPSLLEVAQALWTKELVDKYRSLLESRATPMVSALNFDAVVQAVLEELRNFPCIESIGITGSVARGDYDENSDVDIVYELDLTQENDLPLLQEIIRAKCATFGVEKVDFFDGTIPVDKETAAQVKWIYPEAKK